MLKEVRFRNFKCFKDLKLNELKRFNLVGGMNNVGKTALLEGIFLCAGPTKTDLTQKINNFRGIEVFELTGKGMWENLFKDFNVKEPIKIEYIDKKDFKRYFEIILEPYKTVIYPKGQSEKQFHGDELTGTKLELDHILKYIYWDNNQSEIEATARIEREKENVKVIFDTPPVKNPFEAIFINARVRTSQNEESNRFSKLVVEKRKGDLITALKVIDNRIENVESITIGGYSSLYLDLGYEKMLPIQIVGEGTVKYLSMLLAVANSPNGVVLIDELENGIHHSILERAISSIFKFAEYYDVQIFATTHSWELVEKAINVFRNISADSFKYTRLDKIDGEIVPKEYDKESIFTAIEENFEVR